MTLLKKCIVLDLDNTLWGGVVGEDGFDGITLSLNAPGAYFIAFQQALRDLYDRGVILAINSKNNPDDALSVIRAHPNMILKENHFAAMRINWAEKSDNLRELAKELNIGLDSMVFLDDSPHNRENVRALVPEVETPELPADPAQYVKFLHSLPYFAANAITDEDNMRGNLYVTERLRKEVEKSFINHEEFLKSLGTELHFFEDDPRALARLAQLTEKTNQFNVKKRPLNEREIQNFIESDDYAVFHAQAIDQFGDQGIIAFALVRKEKKLWHIESLLMSCRVIGRGIEDAFIAEIAARAARSGALALSIAFELSDKNEPARVFVDRVFGNARTVSSDTMRPPHIKII
jgi:FkbH-like protein